MKMRNAMTIAAAAVLAVGLAACGDDQPDSPTPAVTVTDNGTDDAGAPGGVTTDDATTDDTATDGTDDTAVDDDATSGDGADDTAAGPGGSLEDAAQARELALALVKEQHGGDGIVIDQDLDDSGKWEIDVLLGDVVHDVDVRDGAATHDGTDDADDDDRAAAAASVTIDEAIEAALNHTPGTLKEASWDDDGRWEIEVYPTGQTSDIDLYVDPNTAEVTPDN